MLGDHCSLKTNYICSKKQASSINRLYALQGLPKLKASLRDEKKFGHFSIRSSIISPDFHFFEIHAEKLHSAHLTVGVE